MSSSPTLWAIVVTFRRGRQLRVTLEMLASQTRRIDRMLIVDNGSQSECRETARQFGASYLDAGDNLGPAGGIALGMRTVLREADETDWVALLDDDDPPRDPRAIEQLLAFGEEMVQCDAETGGVGLVGAQYNPRLGVVLRVPDEALVGPVAVDHIGGGHLPLYRVSALRSTGVFNPAFFFGFEELEYGLRLGSPDSAFMSMAIAGEGPESREGDWARARAGPDLLARQTHGGVTIPSATRCSSLGVMVAAEPSWSRPPEEVFDAP